MIIEVICENCGSKVQKDTRWIKNNKHYFCSSKCQHQWRTGKVEIWRHKGEYKNCPICNKEFYCSIGMINKKKTCSRICSYELQRLTGIHQKENCNFWTGGFDGYRGANWYKQRSETRIRDNNICQICGKTHIEEGKNMIVHHIVPFRFFQNDYLIANHLNNLLCVCHNCHSKQKSHLWNNVPEEYQYLLQGIESKEKIIRINRFTLEEIKYIKDNYKKIGATKISKFLNRPYNSIIEKAMEFNLTKKNIRWSDEEIKILKENFLNASKKEIITLLPHRTYRGIVTHAKRLKFNTY